MKILKNLAKIILKSRAYARDFYFYFARFFKIFNTNNWRILLFRLKIFNKIFFKSALRALLNFIFVEDFQSIQYVCPMFFSFSKSLKKFCLKNIGTNFEKTGASRPFSKNLSIYNADKNFFKLFENLRIIFQKFKIFKSNKGKLPLFGLKFLKFFKIILQTFFKIFKQNNFQNACFACVLIFIWLENFEKRLQF